jgi:3',5'-nucleoside bisphosphate phosphatase
VRIDLHAHSTASDGTDTPAGLVRAAAHIGLDVVALTDHDTTAGWDEALDAADAAGVLVVPGCEVSCAATGLGGAPITVHLLAYRFDPAAPALVAEQSRLRAERRSRLRAMVAHLAADGIAVDERSVFDGLAPDAPAGRPHLARALVRAGVVGSVDEAFERHLRDGGPYHIRRVDTPVRDAVRMIADAGGVTVLAHAMATRRGAAIGDAAIAELAAVGLSGLEVDHPEHDRDARTRLRFLAAELGLVATGGSDYHGTNKRTGLAVETTAPAAFHELMARVPRPHRVRPRDAGATGAARGTSG